MQELIRKAHWYLRNTLTLSAPLYKNVLSKPGQLIDTLSETAQQRYEDLQRQYRIESWNLACERDEYLESLYILDLCDRHLTIPTQGPCLDVGSKRWSYLPGLHSFAPHPWDGIELDPHRRLWNLVTRGHYGQTMARDFPKCHYLTGSVQQLQKQYTLITWFLPFVSREPLMAWGLPAQYFQPQQLLQHTWDLLQPGGQLFIMNQGAREAELQQALFDDLHIPVVTLGEMKSEFTPYRITRFGWLVVKKIR
jgi:hypothetical protein